MPEEDKECFLFTLFQTAIHGRVHNNFPQVNHNIKN
jgi:hypothetical protein